jgi:hypothetical protein
MMMLLPLIGANVHVYTTHLHTCTLAQELDAKSKGIVMMIAQWYTYLFKHDLGTTMNTCMRAY